MMHAIRQCKLIIANSADVTTPTELFALYDVADAYCNRDAVGDELADEVYYHLAIACERLGLDPLALDVAPNAQIVSMHIDCHYRVDVEVFDANGVATGDFAHLCLRATTAADAMQCARDAGYDAFGVELVLASESESSETVWCVSARK